MSTEKTIRRFLQSQKPAHADPSLLDLYRPGMEVQVQVDPSGGEQLEGGFLYADASGNQFWSFRIPHKKTGGAPKYKKLFDLAKHTGLIGMTGRNWQTGKSEWVGIDLDSMREHEKGLSDDRLNELVNKLKPLPYVRINRSKSATGYHVRVFFAGDGVATADRKEHATLARAVLAKIGNDVGEELTADADGVGCNLWIWSKATKEGGFLRCN